MALQLRERKSPFIHVNDALHPRLGTPQRSCCYCAEQ